MYFYVKTQRKCKGNPAREARRGDLIVFLFKTQRKYKGNPAREARPGYSDLGISTSDLEVGIQRSEVGIFSASSDLRQVGGRNFFWGSENFDLEVGVISPQVGGR